MIFKAADKKHIKISIDSAMIVFKLKTQGAIQDARLIDHERDWHIDRWARQPEDQLTVRSWFIALRCEKILRVFAE